MEVARSMMERREIQAKSVLSRSGISGIDYCLNPYVGCGHGCRYCYASFMKRFTGHREPWGTFVDAKINAPEVLARELQRVRAGHILISSVTDPYQPLEKEYGLTRRCLEVLRDHDLSVEILTKSPLVLRDLEILKGMKEIEVGLTITTDDEKVRQIFEPHAPPIEARIEALQRLSAEGISTYAFIGPILPMNPEGLAEKIRPFARHILIDRMNYVRKTQRLFAIHRFGHWLEEEFLQGVLKRLEESLRGKEVYFC